MSLADDRLSAVIFSETCGNLSKEARLYTSLGRSLPGIGVAPLTVWTQPSR
jgi:hypothetical protein